MSLTELFFYIAVTPAVVVVIISFVGYHLIRRKS